MGKNKKKKQYVVRLTKDQLRRLHEQLLKSHKIPNKKKHRGPNKEEWT